MTLDMFISVVHVSSFRFVSFRFVKYSKPQRPTGMWIFNHAQDNQLKVIP